MGPVDETTTTTTEVDEHTTTTTTEKPADREDQDKETTTDSTTQTAAPSTAPVAEKRGEQTVDKDAKAKVLGDDEESFEDRMDGARRDALRNSEHDQDLKR